MWNHIFSITRELASTIRSKYRRCAVNCCVYSTATLDAELHHLPTTRCKGGRILSLVWSLFSDRMCLCEGMALLSGCEGLRRNGEKAAATAAVTSSNQMAYSRDALWNPVIFFAPFYARCFQPREQWEMMKERYNLRNNEKLFKSRFQSVFC